MFLNPIAARATLTDVPSHSMMHFLLPPLAVTGTDFALIMVLTGMGLSLLSGGLGMFFHHRRQVLWHETARIALEKGQPIPLSPGDGRPPGAAPAGADAARQIRAGRIRGYLLGGLINLAVGAGLFIALAQISRPTAYFAAIPGFIGLALLLAAGIEGLMGRDAGR